MDKKEQKVDLVAVPYTNEEGKNIKVFALYIDDKMLMSTAVSVLADYCKRMVECAIIDPDDWFEVSMEELSKGLADAKVLTIEEQKELKQKELKQKELSIDDMFSPIDRANEAAEKYTQCIRGAREAREKNDKELYKAFVYDALKNARVSQLWLKLAQQLDEVG